MKRMRGKRMFLLAASALPLLAEDDVPAIVEGQYQQQQQHDTLPCAAQSIVDNDILSRLPALSTFDWLDSSEVVIPFRPTLWNNTGLEKRKQQDHSHKEPHSDDVIETRESPQDGNHTTTATTTTSQANTTAESITAHEVTDTDTTLDNIHENETELEQIPEENATGSSTEESNNNNNSNSDPGMMVDYASKSAGALVLEKSSNFQGTSNLLNGDRDKYAIVPCEQQVKYVVIGLSEEILVKQVEIANYERYSSHVREFNVLGSTVMGNWVDLGTYESKLGNGKQTFVLKEPSWARYLKFRILSHYGHEHYLTVSQISVFGSTMLQGFHEQWNEEENGQAEVPIQESVPSSEVVQEEVKDIDVSNTANKSHCFTALNAVCLNDIDFERSVFLFNSVNHSDFETIGALSAASVCLSSTQSLQSFSRGTFQELHRDAIVPPARKDGDDEASMIAKARENSESSGILSDSQVVKTIQNLIKKTAGIQVDLESKVDGLIKKSAKDDSHIKEKDTATTPKAVTAESTVSVPLSDEAAPRTDASHRNEKAVAEESPNEDGILSDDATHMLASDLLSPAVANVLQRLPSAECLVRLDFAKFKSRVLSGRGAAPPGSASSPQSATEPIFKKLTDEIKALQSNVVAHDQFTKEFVTCLQRVVMDLMVEFEALQVEQDVRFNTKLEELAARASGRAERTSLLIGFVSTIISLLLCYVNRACNKKTNARCPISRSLSDSELSKRSKTNVV